MKKYIMHLFLLAVFAIALTTCETVANVIDHVAQTAASFGLVKQENADRVSQAAQAAPEHYQAFKIAREVIEPEQTYYIGRAVGANILSRYRVYNGNPALTTYLNRICGAITVNSSEPRPYKGYFVNILDTDEVNAFATPGGHIFLTRGLIASADSEDALAGVIAHEIAHIQLQHGIESISNSRWTQFWTGVGTTAVDVFAGVDVNEMLGIFGVSVDDIVRTLIEKGYSREQELEADSAALGLMAGAGYYPQGLLTMLRALERSSNYSGRGFDNTHPTPAQRISNAQRRINQYRVEDTRQYRQARFTSVTR